MVVIAVVGITVENVQFLGHSFRLLKKSSQRDDDLCALLISADTIPPGEQMSVQQGHKSHNELSVGDEIILSDTTITDALNWLWWNVSIGWLYWHSLSELKTWLSNYFYIPCAISFVYPGFIFKGDLELRLVW